MPPHSPCPEERGRGGSEEGATAVRPAPPALPRSVGHCGVQGGGGPGGSEPWGHGRAPMLPPPPLQGWVPPCWGPLGRGYLVATEAGTVVGAQGVVVACALVLAGAGEAGVAFGLDAQGRRACWTGGADVTISVGSDRMVSICGHWHEGAEPQPQLGADLAPPRGCAQGNGIAMCMLGHQGCATSQVREGTEASWSPSSTRQLNR